MDAFSFLSVLLSIILGLAITQILQNAGRLIQFRARVKFYWVPVAWAALLLVVYVQTWWAMFGLRTHASWTFGGFSVVLLQTICLYLLAALVLPESSPEGGVIDLRANYFGHHRWFFGIAIAATLVSLSKDLVLDGHLPERANVLFHAAFGAMSLVAFASRREWIHKAFVPIGGVAFALYITFLFARLSS